MTDEKKVIKRRPKHKFNPKNKEQASYKKKKFKKKAPERDLQESLKELRDYFNNNFHTK